MACRIVSAHAGNYGMGIYAIMLPSSGFSVAHFIPQAQPVTADTLTLYRLRLTKHLFVQQ